MDFLLQLDQQLFFFFNHTCHTAFFNKLMPYYRSMYFWIPLYLFVASYLILNFRLRGWLFLGVVMLNFAISDTMSSKIIKPLVARERPCNNAEMSPKVKLLVKCGSGYSFTSSHATNHFALAFFLSATCLRKRRSLRWAVILWAVSVVLGQIYVGVHYPSDIFGGAVLGYGIARLVSYFYLRACERYPRLQID